MWQESLAVFLESYTACTTLKESTHQFSTDEIRSMLEQHTANPVNADDLVKTLKDRGFKYARTGDLAMEWLMIQQELTE